MYNNVPNYARLLAFGFNFILTLIASRVGIPPLTAIMAGAIACLLGGLSVLAYIGRGQTRALNPAATASDISGGQL